MFRRRSEPWHRGTRPTHGDRAKGAGSRRAAPSRTASRARGGASPSVATSPDGSAIALERMNTGSTPDHVVVIRPPAPAATVVFSAKAPFESSLCWSPDGARIAVSTDNAHDPRRCGRRQRCDHAVRDQRQNVVLAALDSRSRQTDRRVHPATVASAPTRWATTATHRLQTAMPMMSGHAAATPNSSPASPSMAGAMRIASPDPSVARADAWS